MKLVKILVASALALSVLAACGDGVDWSDPANPLCTSGHYEDDWDNKKVADGTERKYNSMKKKWETKTKYKTVKVYDGQDWVCDVKQAS